MEEEQGRTSSRGLFYAFLITAAIAVAFFGLWITQRGADEDEVAAYLREEAGPAAGVAAEAIDALMNYDASSVAQRKDDLAAISTTSFESEYEELVEGGLGRALEAADARSTGEVVTGPEVSFTSGTKASAIARVAQEVTTTRDPDGRNVFYVMKLGLVLQDGSWEVDELEILSQTSD